MNAMQKIKTVEEYSKRIINLTNNAAELSEEETEDIAEAIVLSLILECKNYYEKM